MTAFALKLASATFNTALKGLRLPSRRKLVAEYLLGVSQAESVKNRANPNLPLTVQNGGGIIYNARSVTVHPGGASADGFLTGIIPNDDATLIVVRKNCLGGSQPMVVTTSENKFGVGQNGGLNQGWNGEVDFSGPASRAIPASNSTVYFEALTLSRQNAQLATGGLGTLYWYAAGVRQSAVAAAQNTTARTTIGQICIGTTFARDTGVTNTCEVFFVALYQRSLTTAEIDAAYAQIVAYYASIGITVV